MTAILNRPATGGALAVKPVVTGLGVIAPNGIGVAEYWVNTVAGRSGIGPVQRFDISGYDAKLAGEVSSFEPRQHIPGRLLPQTDHMTRLALVAADEALGDSGVDVAALPDFAGGVMTAGSAGGFEFGQRELQALWSQGGSYVSAYQSFAWFYPVNTGQISIKHDLRGPSAALVADQAGGLDAVAKAGRSLRDGAQLMVAGAVDSAICPWGWVCMQQSGWLSTESDPAFAYRPFGPDADGAVPGEGGALLILEHPDAADARAADRYGRIIGHAATFDPPPHSGRPSALRRAIELALARAELRPEQIDLVLADGAGVFERDRVEAEALATVFGARAVPVSVPKSMTGRLFAGGGPLDLATGLLAIRDGVIPPTINAELAGHADLIDLVGEQPREAGLSAVLVIARGVGGFNSVMVLSR